MVKPRLAAVIRKRDNAINELCALRGKSEPELDEYDEFSEKFLKPDETEVKVKHLRHHVTVQ